MEENINPVNLMDFTKISPEVSEIGTRLKRWKENMSFLFSKYYGTLFGYSQRPGNGINSVTVKPLSVSLVKRPMIQHKNYFK